MASELNLLVRITFSEAPAAEREEQIIDRFREHIENFIAYETEDLQLDNCIITTDN